MIQRIDTEWTPWASSQAGAPAGTKPRARLRPCRLTSEGITDLAFYADHLRAFLYSPNICVCIPEQDTPFLKTDFAKA